MITRRELLTLALLTSTVTLGRRLAIQETSEERQKDNEYQRLLTEFPAPEVHPAMLDFTRELANILPAYSFHLEHIRTGAFDEETQRFGVDRQHVIVDTGMSMEMTRAALTTFDEIYTYVRDVNNYNGIPDRIGISEQVRRRTDTEPWKHTINLPITLPSERNEDALVGIGIRGTFDAHATEPDLFFLVGGPSHLEAFSADPNRHLSIAPSRLDGNYRSPFLFDALPRLGPEPELIY